MEQAPIDVVVAAYTSEDGAKNALHELNEARKERVVDIKDAAVLRKDMDDKLHVVDVKDLGFGRGAILGGVTGAVVGIIAGPVGWAAVGGAAIGGLVAKLRDGGIREDRLRLIGDNLQPGSSALIAVIEHKWIEELERRIKETGAEIATDMIGADIAAQLEMEAEKQSGGETRAA